MSSTYLVTAAPALLFVLGLYYFIKGFWIFREYRVLADTPEIPIRGIAMGLAEVHGTAVGEPSLISPVRKTPCFFYKVDIEEWVETKRDAKWVQVKSDADGVPFYLDDGTGKVLVDAREAEQDLRQCAQQEVWGGVATAGDLATSTLGLSEPAVPAGRRVTTQSDLYAYVESVVKSARLDSKWSVLSRGHRYRLTEYLILPGQKYDATGTCAENPKAQDAYDRNMIIKGENEPTFLMSYRTEKAVEGMLRDRAVASIVSGSVLSVISLAVLLYLMHVL